MRLLRSQRRAVFGLALASEPRPVRRAVQEGAQRRYNPLAVAHDLPLVHEVTVVLPPGARLIGDKAYVSAANAASLLADTGVRLVAARRKKMRPQHECDELAIRTSRRAIETVNSQAEKMGIQRLHARTNVGFELKVIASLIALAITNAD